jgi:branched-chain amino acid transport system permease protein
VAFTFHEWYAPLPDKLDRSFRATLVVLELIVISTLNGVLYGMLLFLMASGLTVIFSMLGVLNFAHASFYMLGAFFGFQISRWFGFWPALVVAPLLAGLIGAAIEHYGLRHVHKNGHVAELLFTFGLAFAVEEVVEIRRSGLYQQS